MKYLKTYDEIEQDILNENLKSFISNLSKDDVINYLKQLIKKYNYKLLFAVIPIILGMNILNKSDILNISSNEPSYNKVLNFLDTYEAKPNSFQYLDSIAQRESTNRPYITNRLGYIGKFQFHNLALIDAGVVKNKKEANEFRNRFIKLDNDDKIKMWTEDEQDQAMINLLNKNKYYLRNYEKYIGDTINGIVIDWSGILAAAHLGGQKHVKEFLKSNGKKDFADANGVKVSVYMKEFSGYNLNLILK
jgi:hypothetical protein